MLLTRWLREITRAPKTRRPAFRPGVESLEARDVPSAGFLDPTFDADGVVTTNFSTSFTPNSQDRAWDVAVYPGSSLGADGKVLVVGTSVTHILRDGTWDWDFALARYNPDGTLDTSFGEGGKVTTSMGSSNDAVYAVELVGGRILVAGNAGGTGIALARYNDNGTLDTAFGSGGKVFTKLGGGGDGYAMKVDDAGRIVVLGEDAKATLTLVRYTSNGVLDKTFGKGGIAVSGGLFGSSAGMQDLAITPASAGPADASKIVVVTGSGGGLAVARFTTTGALDTSFDGDGIVVGPANNNPRSVAVQADGRIVVATSGSFGGIPSYPELQLMRFNTDGTSDTSLGGTGQVVVPRPGTQYATSITVQPDGKILVAGDEWFPSQQENGNFFVACFSAAGELDPTYGVGGFAVSAENNLQRGGQPNVEIALTDNGKAVVCGWTNSNPSGGGYADFAVARFLGDDALHAASAAPNTVSVTLSTADVKPRLAEAIARWRAAGADTSSLLGIDIRIADLGGTTLGFVSGNTIWLDDNAAGWGWFVDPTPGDDAEFTTPGNQGERNRVDLLSVLMHEIGHVLGRDHDASGVMAPSLGAGTRLTVARTLLADWDWVAPAINEIGRKRR